jgi:hypothetical protein
MFAVFVDMKRSPNMNNDFVSQDVLLVRKSLLQIDSTDGFFDIIPSLYLQEECAEFHLMSLYTLDA